MIYQHVSRAAQKSLALSAQLGTKRAGKGMGEGSCGGGEGGQRQSHKYDVFVLRVAASKCACHTRHAAELTLFRQVQQAGEAEGTEGGGGERGRRGSVRGFIKILISTAKSTPAAAEQKMCAARKLFLRHKESHKRENVEDQDECRRTSNQAGRAHIQTVEAQRRSLPGCLSCSS